MRLCPFVLILGILITAESVEWTKIRTNIKSRVRQAPAVPAHQLTKVKSALNNRADKFKAMVAEEVYKADIRLLMKDSAKSAASHPLLSAAQIDESQGKSIFETDWVEFFTWLNDLDSEYKPVRKADMLFSSENYNSSLSTLLILHDRCGSARDQNVQKIKEALKLRNFDVNYNILMLDFERFMCHTISPTTGLFKLGFHPQLQLLATEISKILYKGIKRRKLKAEQINLVGLGISTHLAGLIARNTRKMTGQKINSILGLDPPTRLRRAVVSSKYATYIHIYHTFKLVPGTGPKTGQGTADFVFGGAKRGPPCKKSLRTSCFTAFGVQLFVSTLLYPRLFPARWCPDFHKFSEHFCDSNEHTFVSFPPDKSANGTYQMDINYKFPYGKGWDGIYEKPEQEEEDTFPGSEEVAKLSVQEYLHRLEVELSHIRSDMIACMHGVSTPTAVIRCIMATQPSVRKLEKNHLIRKINCEPWSNSPTGRKCNYETRTRNAFELPF